MQDVRYYMHAIKINENKSLHCFQFPEARVMMLFRLQEVNRGN